jgi:hypothetical protein
MIGIPAPNVPRADDHAVNPAISATGQDTTIARVRCQRVWGESRARQNNQRTHERRMGIELCNG